MDTEIVEEDDMHATPVHVRSFELKGLFRQYDHHIELRQEDRVTIIHGRNGVGKTVTLSLVAALLQGRYSQLAKFPFQRLRLDFTDGSYIEAQPVADKPPAGNKGGKRPKRGQTRRNGAIEISYALAGGERKSFSAIDSEREAVEAFAREQGWLEPLGEERWIDRRDGELLTTAEIIQRYLGRLPGLSNPRIQTNRTPEGLEVQAFCKRMPVHFIEAQRLFKIGPQIRRFGPEEPAVTTAVKDVAEEVAQKIKETDSTYRATSTRLDDSLPSRLFSPDATKTPLLENELMGRKESLEKERARLREIGIIADSKTDFNLAGLDETRRAMFAVYLNDNEEKLAVFRDLADRSEILLKIINGKFAPKRVELDKDDGYKVFSHDNRALDLARLSSGEQHELVLLHNLLFRVEAGSLLLIDEPELSLHVSWQNEFLADLIAIAKRVQFDALIATHSPYIVGGRRDLMVQLGQPE